MNRLDFDSCVHCNEKIDFENCATKQNNARLFLPGHGTIVRTESCQCTSEACKKWNHFDGRDMHIFNSNSLMLVHHSLLNGFFNAYTTSLTPMHAFIRQKKREYEENNSIQFMSYTTFSDIFSDYVEMQKWEYGYGCPFCKEVKYINYDGICMGIKSKNANDLNIPTTVHESETIIQRCNLRSNRFIIDVKLRKQYQRWAVGIFGTYKREHQKKFPSIKGGEKTTFIRNLKKFKDDNKKIYESLIKLMLWAENQVERWENDDKDNKIYWKHIFRCIGGDEPVYQLAHYHIRNILQDKNQILAEKDKIMKYSPLIGFITFNDKITKPDEWWEVCAELGARSDRIITKLINKRKSQQPLQVPTAQQVQAHSSIESGCFYSEPYQRLRPRYAWDHIPKDEQNIATECNKAFAKFNDKVGALWITRCAIHGFADGFHIVPKSEGLNDPFSAILCHRRVAPELAIGDFNCQLQPYGCNREPEIFLPIVHAIDECHTKAHTRCSIAYNMRIFKNAHYSYNLVNDSTCEQRNNIIKRLKKQAIWMKKRTFMVYARLLLEIDNRNLYRKYCKLPVY